MEYFRCFFFFFLLSLLVQSVFLFNFSPLVHVLCRTFQAPPKVFNFFFLFLIAVLLCWWSITSRSRVTCNQGLFRFFLATREKGSPFRLALENYLKKGGEESNAGCMEVFPLAGKGSGTVVRLDLVDTTRPAGTVKFSSICDPRACWILIVHAVYLLGSLFVLLEFFSSIAGLR